MTRTHRPFFAPRTFSSPASADFIAMNQDSSQLPHHSRRKCASCGLVNTDTDELCRRCGIPLDSDDQPQTLQVEPEPGATVKKRSFLKRVSWVMGATSFTLVIWYASLLTSSDALQPDQRDKVQNAIAVLSQQGFTREAFFLKRLAAFRSTDNWWNKYIGHRDAYAATNFPFEIVTLYPEFFDVPVDDKERAAVLLHESRHLLGDGEEAALRTTWQGKQRLGWTADRYQQTRVWDATERLTKAQFPYMFQCGANGQSDCY